MKTEYFLRLLIFLCCGSSFAQSGVGTINSSKVSLANNHEVDMLSLSGITLDLLLQRDGVSHGAVNLRDIEANTGVETELFFKDFGSRLNGLSVAFTKNYDTLYMAGNNTEKRFTENSRGYDKSRLYRSVRKGDSWSKLEELPFNSNRHSTVQPSLSADGRTLYFSSDRPGGHGGMDIYFVALLPNGIISEPINLGPEVNTKGNETFPHIGTDYVLFFASDSHPGLGGTDIFALDTKVSKGGCVINMGNIINSRFNDLSIVFNEDYTEGYFVSDRSGQLKMHIFSVKLNDPGAFVDKCKVDTDLQIVGVDSENRKAGGAIKESLLKASMLQAFEDLDLDPVLFSFDSAILTDNGKETLLEMARFMNVHKNVGLHIYGHTHSTRPEYYNLILSKKRAESILRFLTEQGVAGERLVALGMDEE